MIPIEQEAPRSAAELRSAVAGLKSRLSDAARRGDHYAFNAAQTELHATNRELADAERRELNEAAAAHRLKTARTQAGMDVDGTLKSQGYDSPGALIADMINRGPVRVQLENYLRDAGITPPKSS
jgi:hypothetical protein